MAIRVLLAAVGLLTTWSSLLARNALNLAIVQMSSAAHQKSMSKSTSMCLNTTTVVSSLNQTVQDSEPASFEWSNKQHGLMLGGFFFGYAIGFPFVQV